MPASKTDGRPTDDATTWLVELVHMHRLSPTQRRVVQYMLDSLPEVAFASTIEIADAAGVSQPTVTRLATTLGFASYPEFRTAIREVVLAQSGQPSGKLAPLTNSALDSELANLRTLEDTVDSDRMRRATDLLAATRPLGVIGLRASSALAHYFGYFAQRVLPDVRVFDDAASLDDSVLQLQQDGASALLAFVMPRYPAATVRALATARHLGLSTIVIVDTPFVPFPELIDVALVAPVAQDLVFDSHAAAVTLSIVLLNAVAGRDPRRTQARLEEHEKLVAGWALKSR